MQFFLENKSKMDRLNICINFFVEEKNKRLYKRYVVWESTPIISFCWSVCYWKWWRHYTWWIEPHWWRQLLSIFQFFSLCFFIKNIFLSLFFLLKIFFSLCFYQKKICKQQHLSLCTTVYGRAMSGWFMALFLWKTTFS